MGFWKKTSKAAPETPRQALSARERMQQTTPEERQAEREESLRRANAMRAAKEKEEQRQAQAAWRREWASSPARRIEWIVKQYGVLSVRAAQEALKVEFGEGMRAETLTKFLAPYR